MAKRQRVLAPGEAQQRRATYCAKLLGYTLAVGFVAAIVVGIPFPGVWQALFVPLLSTVPFALIFLTLWFSTRMIWFKARARHFAAVAKMRSETR